MIVRIERDPQKFESFELFATLCALNSIPLNGIESIEKATAVFQKSLEANIGNLSLLFGKRTEQMFGYVASGLGGSILIKQEDGGEIYCNSDISVPDFRLVLKDGTSILVEVKNFHGDPFDASFALRSSYLESLRKYGEITKTEIKVAIYYSQLSLWVLLPLDGFKLIEGSAHITAADAMMRNVLITKGSAILGIRFRFVPIETNSDQPFDMVGPVSCLLSNMHRNATEHSGELIAIKVNSNPQNFSALIPQDYDSSALPLWRFMQSANKD